MQLAVLLVLPFAAALAAALVPGNARTRAALLAGGAAVAGALLTASRWPTISRGEVLVQRIEWVPALGLHLTLRLDGFAWLMCLLVFGVGALVVLYARYYLSPADPVPRFFSLFLAFMGAMVGLVVSGNLLQLAFFWELTSLCSFLLIGYWHQRRDAQRGARLALTVTGLGGLALLAGVLLLGHIAHSYELDAVLASGPQVRAHPLYPVALALLLLAAFTKSAQLPFHFWLPHAMAAPTPVSAYLHSATMVKAGVFLLARLWPVLSGTEAWFWAVGTTGLLTLLIGAYLALYQTDLKALLAYSTISHLGLITLLLGLNSRLAAVAAIFHLMNHATFKASLFMAAGIVDHETGTRDLRRLSGLYRVMPITGTLAVVASAAMAGVPLLNGFLSKEMFFAETLFLQTHPLVEWSLPVLATLAGMGSVAYALRFAGGAFFGRPLDPSVPRQPHEPPFFMRAPVGLLAVVCLVVGIMPDASVRDLLDAAARPVAGGELPEFDLKLWHGFNLPFVMSLLAMAGGVVGFAVFTRRASRGATQRPLLAGTLDGKLRFEQAVAALTRLARTTRKTLGAAGLQAQLFLLVATALLLAFLAWRQSPIAGARPLLPLSPAFAALWLAGGAAALGAAWQAERHRLAALMLAAVAGVACIITFNWFSAPDLALTQLAVETVTTVLMLLGLRWLPVPPARKEPGRGTRDLLLAVAAGAGLAVLAYAVATRSLIGSISTFFLERAYSEAGGRNVVNVMLVDFRGFDTFGEGVVLAIVALTVYALLRRFRPPSEMLQPPEQQRAIPRDLQTDLLNPRHASDTAVGYLMVPAVLVRLLLPVSFVVAAYLFLRGHHEPGGGFVAGLVFSAGLLLQYIVSGTVWTESHLRLDPRRFIAAGLLLVAGTAASALAVSKPWLTSQSWHGTLPLLGEVHLSSVLSFDLGVMCLVVGATLFILTSIAHQSVRADRGIGSP